MIGRLSGTLLEKDPPFLLIDIGGIGYEVQSSITTMSLLPQINQPVTVYIHMVTREDSQSLYGFSTKTERLLFQLLIKASGVGPKMALGILSSLSANDFVQCVKEKSVERLTKIPGVGKKTAERLLIEMQDKIKKHLPQEHELSTVNTEIMHSTNHPNQTQADAVSALEVLGYKSSHAMAVVSKIDKTDLECSELVRLALKALNTA